VYDRSTTRNFYPARFQPSNSGTTAVATQFAANGSLGSSRDLESRLGTSQIPPGTRLSDLAIMLQILKNTLYYATVILTIGKRRPIVQETHYLGRGCAATMAYTQRKEDHGFNHAHDFVCNNGDWVLHCLALL